VARWQARIVIVVLGGCASWALISRVTRGWQSDCVPHELLSSEMRCSWFTTWSPTVRVLVSVLPGALLAVGALALSSYNGPSYPGMRVRLAGRGTAVVASAAALALVVAGFLPWFGDTWADGQSGAGHSHASGWASSSHWSRGLIFVAVGLGVFAAFAWRRRAVPVAGMAVVAVCLVIGVGELSAQWWLLLRPVHRARPIAVIRIFDDAHPEPPQDRIGYIGRDALVWIRADGFRSAPTAVAYAASGVAYVMAAVVTAALLSARRKNASTTAYVR
jgi:hypothetical protein